MGAFEHGKVEVEKGQIFRFDLSGDSGTAERVTLPHAPIFDAIEEGHMLLIDDGKLRNALVEAKKGQMIAAEVLKLRPAVVPAKA